MSYFNRFYGISIQINGIKIFLFSTHEIKLRTTKIPETCDFTLLFCSAGGGGGGGGKDSKYNFLEL